MTRKNNHKTSNKPGAPRQNKNAFKKDKKNKWLQVRVTAEELRQLKKTCEIANIKLSNYVRNKLGL